MATRQIVPLHSLPTMLIGSRSCGNGMAPEDSWGKKAAKVSARMAGRTGGGELGISLILAEDVTSPETHGPQQIDLPPEKRRKVIRVRTVSMSEPHLCLNNHSSSYNKLKYISILLPIILYRASGSRYMNLKIIVNIKLQQLRNFKMVAMSV